MSDESKPTVVRVGERSFDELVELSRLVDDVVAYLRATGEQGADRSPEALKVRLLWRILQALDDRAAALALSSAAE